MICPGCQDAGECPVHGDLVELQRVFTMLRRYRQVQCLAYSNLIAMYPLEGGRPFSDTMHAVPPTFFGGGYNGTRASVPRDRFLEWAEAVFR